MLKSFSGYNIRYTWNNVQILTNQTPTKIFVEINVNYFKKKLIVKQNLLCLKPINLINDVKENLELLQRKVFYSDHYSIIFEKEMRKSILKKTHKWKNQLKTWISIFNIWSVKSFKGTVVFLSKWRVAWNNFYGPASHLKILFKSRRNGIKKSFCSINWFMIAF